MYKKQEVYESTLEYFQGDELATNVWIDKYCLKNNKGDLLERSPLDMYDRLAKEFARIEKKYPNPLSYEEIYELLKEQVIIPGGSILYGVGNNYSYSSLGNCFVIGNDADSYGGIFHTDQEQGQLMKRRAGVGHDISHLRPAFTPVSNAAGTSTGAVSFMPRYSNTTREVGQDGRRGALMLTMNINHPDSEKFIVSKDDLTKVTGANISVKLDDYFINLVDENDKFNFIEGPTREAKNIWEKLVHQAWKSAEPGVLFWDKVLSEDIPSCYGKEWTPVSTNPCGEIPLCPYDSCRLISVNLTKFVNFPFQNEYSSLKSFVDWDALKDSAYKAQRLMDDIVDLEEEKIDKILKKIENDPEEYEVKITELNLWYKIKDKLLKGRRTGLSAIGIGDMLAMLGLPYGEASSISVVEEVYKEFAIAAYKSSIDMAKERGAFPIFDIKKELNDDMDEARVPFLERMMDAINESEDGWKVEDYVDYGRRNIALLTIPPSGTISLLAGISSGIEPVYQLSYNRRRKVNPDNPRKNFQDKNGDWWEEYKVLHPGYKQWLDLNVDKITRSMDEEKYAIVEHEMKNPYHGSLAYELDPIDRVKMQGAIQKWIDHSISSTINLPKTATEEDVANIYLTAWKEGLKGITIYRDGCRDGVIFTESSKTEEFKPHNAPKRPKELPCDIYTPTAHGQQYVVAIGLYDNRPYEVFAIKWDGKFNATRGIIKKIRRGRYDIISLDDKSLVVDITSDMSQIEEDRTRLISAALRHGADIKFLVEQLSKARGNGFQDFSKVIARTLKKYIKDKEKVTGATCENCGSSDLVYKDGCVECNSCGNSKCS